jgi:hypothetical protein
MSGCGIALLLASAAIAAMRHAQSGLHLETKAANTNLRSSAKVSLASCFSVDAGATGAGARFDDHATAA